MHILVIGAGVIGTVYAAKLREGGNAITVVARGDRIEEIRRDGLQLVHAVTGERSNTVVNVTERLGPSDQYDAAIITVRRDQLAALVPDLERNTIIPTLLFMLNNPTGTATLTRALGRNRVVLGFPGVGGVRDGAVVRYAAIAQQPTTLGEIDGQPTARLRALAAAFRRSQLRVVVSRNMDAWLKTHAMFMTAICGAIYQADGDCQRLSNDRDTLGLMARSVREGFTALETLGVRITPFSLRLLFSWLPRSFVVSYWSRFLRRPIADCVMGGHARNAPVEMREIANDCRDLLDRSGVEAPTLRTMFEAIERAASAPVPVRPSRPQPHRAASATS